MSSSAAKPKARDKHRIQQSIWSGERRLASMPPGYERSLLRTTVEMRRRQLAKIKKKIKERNQGFLTRPAIFYMPHKEEKEDLVL